MRRSEKSNNRRCQIVIGLVVFFSFLLAPALSFAYHEPALNLGFTTFLDGGPPAGPGFYFSQYFQYYNSDKLTDSDGDELLPPFADEDLDVFISLSQLIYHSNQPILFGGKWGFELIIPYVGLDLDYEVNGPFPEDNGSGFGDILIGPFIQWDPIMGKKGPIFMHRFEISVIVPTGKYDDDKELNPGSNFFSINPYWSATLFITPRWTVSGRFHYLWNAKNDDPNRQFAGADDTQAGQAFHVNFSSAYEIVPNRFRVGINGYYLKQFTDTEVDGHDISDSKEQVLGLGPGFVIHFSRDIHLVFNAYFETQVENRPKGERYNLRFLYHF
ncbi:MAG TPA: phenol degradation protein meta [Deltaproteobacteria bacterium]|nr:phenol degradation protein meta [Deltaproteobacteria bacterium]